MMSNIWDHLNSTDGYHPNEICRLCLTHGEEMSPIFSHPSDIKSISIPYRIMAFTSIKLVTGDGLPGLICHSCLFNVERVYEFKQQCEQSDAFLRRYFVSKDNSNVQFSDKEIDYIVIKDGVVGDGNDIINNEVLFAEKVKDEDCDEMTSSVLIEAKDGIENLVTVVDPNVRTLDASISDDDENETGIKVIENSDVDEELCENKTDVLSVDVYNNEESTPITDLLHCPSCNKPFSDAQLLARHTKIHNQEPCFPCDYCDLIFTERAALKSHWRDHAGLGRLTCPTCGEVFSDRSGYDQHLVVHDVIKPYHCVVCKRAFSKRSDLRKHIIIHTGISPYVCDTCGKSFKRSTNLKKHARAHIGDRPFDCSKCDKNFLTRADLTRHFITHTGEKPYSCEICGLAVSRRDKLNRHIKLHQKSRPYSCEECSLSFNNKKMLATHHEIHHKKIKSENLSSTVVIKSEPSDANLFLFQKIKSENSSSTVVIKSEPSGADANQLQFTTIVNPTIVQDLHDHQLDS